MYLSTAITYNYFCQLGGLSNPKCAKIQRRNGTFIYYTYHLVRD